MRYSQNLRPVVNAHDGMDSIGNVKPVPVLKKFYQHAEAAYFCNVQEFICTGEGRELSRLENLRIRTRYPEVEMSII
jgi:hypothetical protein